MTECELPERARAEHWPIRLDHCFKRICLDNAFNDAWFRHLARPAQRHLQEPELDRAIAFAQQILAEGLPALSALNQNSLVWRGKSRLGTGRQDPKTGAPEQVLPKRK